MDTISTERRRQRQRQQQVRRPLSALSSSSSSRATPGGIVTTPQRRRHVDWLIVGGGIHGVHVAIRLLGEGITNDPCIIDDSGSLLSQWKARTAATGMTYLRSSAGHHLDIHEDSLRQFAARQQQKRRKRKHKHKHKQQQVSSSSISSSLSSLQRLPVFANDYERPRLDLFNAHCDVIMEKYNLHQRHVHGTVTRIEIPSSSSQKKNYVVRVLVRLHHSNSSSLSDDTIDTEQTTMEMTANHVVLALGNGDPCYPEWTCTTTTQRPNPIATGKVQHLFDTDTTSSTARSKSSTTLQHGEDAAQSVVEPAAEVAASNNYRRRRRRQEEGQQQQQKKTMTMTTVVAIIGGGMTSAHKALQLVEQQQQQHHQQGGMKPKRPTDDDDTTTTTTTTNTVVHLISRHALVERQFDVHQDWMMDDAAVQRSLVGGGSGLPLRQIEFQSAQCLRQRRRIIARERGGDRGATITAALNRGGRGLQYVIQSGQVQWHQGQVTNVTINGEDKDNRTTCTLHFDNGETLAGVDQILLATGFNNYKNKQHLPPMLNKLSFIVDDDNNPQNIAKLLPVSEYCGYPIVDSALRWGGHDSRIFVMGALAELQVGPSARNIAGARMAAERIVQAYKT